MKGMQLRRDRKKLIHCKRGGPGAPGAFILPVILGVIVMPILVVVVVIIDKLYSAHRKKRCREKQTTGKTPPSQTIQNASKNNQNHRGIGIRPPRTSQKILLAIMTFIFIGMLYYLATILK